MIGEQKNMKSSDWLIVPIYRNAFPERIYKIAEQFGTTPEEIAQNERDNGLTVEMGRTILKALPFDMLDLIIDVEESSENKNMTFVMFGDDEGTAIMVMWPIKKFIKELDKFMTGNPKYRIIPETTQTIHFQPLSYPPAPNGDHDEDD